MTRLIECPGCTRHVKADDGHCPFCGRPSTTVAPSRMLVLALPLTLMACTSNEPAKPSPAPEPAPVMTSPPVDPVVPPPDDGPAEGGDAADPVPDSDDRIMVTKYGGPPAPDELVPVPTPAMDDSAVPDDGPADAVEPETTPTEPPDARQPRKYGAPPRPEPRPAKKYGGPPRPDRDPLGGL